MRFANRCLSWYEKYALPNLALLRALRQRAVSFAMRYLHAEDEASNYICLGPVNKMMNMVCCWAVDGGESTTYLKHLPRLDDYLWLAEDGMKMGGEVRGTNVASLFL